MRNKKIDKIQISEMGKFSDRLSERKLDIYLLKKENVPLMNVTR